MTECMRVATKPGSGSGLNPHLVCDLEQVTSLLSKRKGGEGTGACPAQISGTVFIHVENNYAFPPCAMELQTLLNMCDGAQHIVGPQ